MNSGALMTGGPAPELRSGWAVMPFVGEVAHFWREVKQVVPRIHDGERVRQYLALCGATATAYAGAQALEPGNWPKCRRCMKAEKRRT
ncbi:MAG: hypothetical protein Kow0096_14920 [Thiohalomonadaceae bacterium]